MYFFLENEQDLGQTGWCWYQQSHSCRGQLVLTKFYCKSFSKYSRQYWVETKLLCITFLKYFRQFWTCANKILLQNLFENISEFFWQFVKTKFSYETFFLKNIPATFGQCRQKFYCKIFWKYSRQFWVDILVWNEIMVNSRIQVVALNCQKNSRKSASVRKSNA